MPVSSVQYGQTPWHYANGLGIARTGNATLTIASGSILDSTGNFQLSATSTITINAASAGLNGIDTGALAASTVYSVYLVADPVTQQATGAVVSLSTTAPLLPFGYSAYALVGYIVTDASSHFLLGYWSAGNSTLRQFTYDAPQATAITAGAATTYTNVNLITLVPNVAQAAASIYTAFTPGAASRTLNLTAGNGVGDEITVTGQVTAVVVSTLSPVIAQQKTISSVVSPAIQYKVSNSGDAVAISVAGFTFSI